MKNDIRYEGSLGKASALGGLLCCYSYSVNIKAKISDTFDFIPDKPKKGRKNHIYNSTAAIWEFFYNTLLGATRPKVIGDVTESIEGSGCY